MNKLNEELTSHGYKINNMGGGCTAYLKNLNDKNGSYFILTICYKDDKVKLGYATEPTHPEEWPVYFGFANNDCSYRILNPIIHNINDLIKIEKLTLEKKLDLEMY